MDMRFQEAQEAYDWACGTGDFEGLGDFIRLQQGEDEGLVVAPDDVVKEELCLGGCGRYTDNVCGACYECQCVLQVSGAYDMDMGEWN